MHPHPNYSTFWIDFNLSPGSIYMVCATLQPEEAGWMTVMIPESCILCATSSTLTGALTIHLTLSTAPHVTAQSPGDSPPTTAELVFPAATPNLTHILGLMLGDRFTPSLQAARVPKVSHSILPVRIKGKYGGKRKASLSERAIKVSSTGREGRGVPGEQREGRGVSGEQREERGVPGEQREERGVPGEQREER